MSDKQSAHQNAATKQQNNINTGQKYQTKPSQQKKGTGEKKKNFLETVEKDVSYAVDKIKKMMFDPKKTTGQQQTKQTGQKQTKQTGQKTGQQRGGKAGQQRGGQKATVQQTGQQTKQTGQKAGQQRGGQKATVQQSGQQTKQTSQKQVRQSVESLIKELENQNFLYYNVNDVKDILEHIQGLKPTQIQIKRIDKVLKSKDRRLLPGVSKRVLGGKTIYQRYPTYQDFVKNQKKQQTT